MRFLLWMGSTSAIKTAGHPGKEKEKRKKLEIWAGAWYGRSLMTPPSTHVHDLYVVEFNSMTEEFRVKRFDLVLQENLNNLARGEQSPWLTVAAGQDEVAATATMEELSRKPFPKNSGPSEFPVAFDRL